MASTLYPSLTLGDHHTLRVLVCDGPVLLGWVGLFRKDGFIPEEHRVLERLVTPLRQRLRWEAVLLKGLAAQAAAEVAMEALGAPTFLLDASGQIAHANQAGRTRIDREGRILREQLAAACLAPQQAIGTDIWPVRAAGVPQYSLVVLRANEPTLEKRLAQARRDWGLTARQAQLLGLLAEGLANKELAVRLCCSVKTIEAHLSAIYAKAKVDSRSLLLARLWVL